MAEALHQILYSNTIVYFSLIVLLVAYLESGWYRWRGPEHLREGPLFYKDDKVCLLPYSMVTIQRYKQ